MSVGSWKAPPVTTSNYAKTGEFFRASLEQIMNAAGEDKKLSRPHYISETVGRLSGIPFFFEENDLREILYLDLVPRLEQIKDLDIDSLDFKALKEWSTWCAQFDTKLESVVQIV